jgi:hypothetical protein
MKQRISKHSFTLQPSALGLTLEKISPLPKSTAKCEGQGKTVHEQTVPTSSPHTHALDMAKYSMQQGIRRHKRRCSKSTQINRS